MSPLIGTSKLAETLAAANKPLRIEGPPSVSPVENLGAALWNSFLPSTPEDVKEAWTSGVSDPGSNALAITRGAAIKKGTQLLNRHANAMKEHARTYISKSGQLTTKEANDKLNEVYANIDSSVASSLEALKAVPKNAWSYISSLGDLSKLRKQIPSKSELLSPTYYNPGVRAHVLPSSKNKLIEGGLHGGDIRYVTKSSLANQGTSSFPHEVVHELDLGMDSALFNAGFNLNNHKQSMYNFLSNDAPALAQSINTSLHDSKEVIAETGARILMGDTKYLSYMNKSGMSAFVDNLTNALNRIPRRRGQNYGLTKDILAHEKDIKALIKIKKESGENSSAYFNALLDFSHRKNLRSTVNIREKLIAPYESAVKAAKRDKLRAKTKARTDDWLKTNKETFLEEAASKKGPDTLEDFVRYKAAESGLDAYTLWNVAARKGLADKIEIKEVGEYIIEQATRKGETPKRHTPKKLVAERLWGHK